MWHVWEKEEFYTGYWGVYTRVRDHMEYPGIDGRITLTCIFK